MRKIRVLTIDGGGIRGVIPATILVYIERYFQELTQQPHLRLADLFDLIAGTSTGGILTCFYLFPNQDKEAPFSSQYTTKEALEFYEKKGCNIFNASKKKTWLSLRPLFDATSYHSEALEHILNEVFGEVPLSSLLKPCLITSYNMKEKQAVFFNSADSQKKHTDFLIKDVARSTSAAPTYFSPAFISDLKNAQKMVNIDGGVFANNPSMCAYSECRKSVFPQVSYPSAKDILMLSLGTGGGQFQLHKVEKSNKWNILRWAKAMPDIMMDGAIDTVDYQINNIYSSLEETFSRNYLRIDVPPAFRNYASDMADASKKNIKALKEAGKSTLEDAINHKGLNAFIELLVQNAPAKVLA